MKRFRSWLSPLVLAATLALAPGLALAGEAQTLVQARHTEMMAQLKKPASADRDKQVATVLAGLFDYDAMAEASMAKHWSGLSAEQKNEFKGLLKQLIQKNLEKSVKNTLNYNVSFLGEEPATGGVTVKTKAASKTNTREEPIEIGYSLHQTGGAWRAFDVWTEGSSMVNNYKNQFNRIITKEGFPALIKRMKTKLASGG
ncbi:MAG TPA: ABC transporter substrate-binding protein [Polyangiaceae bacterium]|nr:ABC transporter substrate-binding protein [Polyangiaceae bacterium]